jgi:hypothetical protein
MVSGHDDDGTGGKADELLGHTAKKKPGETAAPAPSNNDGVSLPVSRDLDDDLSRVAPPRLHLYAWGTLLMLVLSPVAGSDS